MLRLLRKLKTYKKEHWDFCTITTSYHEQLLVKANSSTMNLKRLRFLYVEIYKTINNLNLSLMKQIFELRVYLTTLNLQKILNLSELLSKTETVLIASVWFVRISKPYFCYPFHLMSVSSVLISNSMFCKCNLLSL